MAILLLTEITPKSVAVHNAQEVARLVVSLSFGFAHFDPLIGSSRLQRDLCCLTVHLGQTSGVAFLNIISCRKNCHISVNGNTENSWFKREKVCIISLDLF